MHTIHYIYLHINNAEISVVGVEERASRHRETPALRVTPGVSPCGFYVLSAAGHRELRERSEYTSVTSGVEINY